MSHIFHVRRKSRRIAAFTLVELLVVIGIISALIAILLPALNKARQAAMTVECASNLRQIGLGIQMYVGDYNGKYPIAYVSSAGYPDWPWPSLIRWDDLLILKGYVTNSDVFICKTAQDFQPIFLRDFQGKRYLANSARHYGIDIYGIGGCNNPPAWSWFPATTYIGVGRVKDPSDRIAVGESDMRLGGISPTANGSFMCGDSAYGGYGSPAKWHNGGGNYLFLDGHVKYLKFAEAAYDTNPPGLDAQILYKWFYPNSYP